MYYPMEAVYLSEKNFRMLWVWILTKERKQLNISGVSAYHKNPVAFPKTRDFQLDEPSIVKKLLITTLME